MSALESAQITFDTPPTSHDPPGRVLKMTAKSYWLGNSRANEQGFCLLFAHGIGARAFADKSKLQQEKPRYQRVNEVWSFDWQSHGDAAIINATGASVLRLRIIAAKDMSPYPYTTVLLVEPTLTSPDLYYKHVAPFQDTMIAPIRTRKERWRSRNEAASWLAKRLPWKNWDQRVLLKFIEYGLYDCENGEVQLKCTRHVEALAFPDVQPHFASIEELGRTSRLVPIHLLWGDTSEIVWFKKAQTASLIRSATFSMP
ncbi:hypothetical protein C8F01DRAFT_1081093 [Mycena amicta]|nr:hypothetical protein C8F01DRAFT_1081093 [Mycena amicta]